MKVLISGGSGLVGTALSNALRADSHIVAHLVRPGGTAARGDVGWNPLTAQVDLQAMEGYDAVVHLSGASIAGGRWTAKRKAILRSSRVDSTRVLVDALAHLKQAPRVFVCASATGYYGNRGDEVLTESSGHGSDFLALLCRAWEGEAGRAASGGMRTVIARFGIVLSTEGGALAHMLTPFRMGAGGRLGSGRQWMSWIALEDAVRVLRAAMDDTRWTGPVNLVAPEPVRNSDFTRVLASVLHRPAILPAPGIALRLALGEMAGALLLASQRVQPERLIKGGFAFRYENLEAALHAILAKGAGT
ncbi:MAG: TIGR01777 family oxidoreductase [Candidatus Acidiferrales bacterium]